MPNGCLALRSDREGNTKLSVKMVHYYDQFLKKIKKYKRQIALDMTMTLEM